MNKKRITWIELLRIAACIAVIGLHEGAQHFTWKGYSMATNQFAVAGLL